MRRQVLGPDVDIRVEAYDETNTVIPVKRHRRVASRPTETAAWCAWSACRATSIPAPWTSPASSAPHGIQVAIGGFHVSGCLAMLPEMPADLREAMDLGVTLFAGEAEGRLDEPVAQRRRRERLKPLYNYMDDLPGLEDAAHALPARGA